MKSWDGYLPAGVIYLLRARMPRLLAAFLPLVKAAGGSAGTQAVGAIVRALAIGEVSERRVHDAPLVARKEASATALFLPRSSIHPSPSHIRLNTTSCILYGGSVAATLAIAVIVGSLLPIAARRLGLDPASASTLLTITLVDVGVSALYLAVAAYMSA